jgi:hypothetical protein
VPDLKKANTAQAMWSAAGFTTTVLFSPAAPASWPPSGGAISNQSLAKNTSSPCNATITVTWH